MALGRMRQTVRLELFKAFDQISIKPVWARNEGSTRESLGSKARETSMAGSLKKALGRLETEGSNADREQSHSISK
jgi:hypothetical protein